MRIPIHSLTLSWALTGSVIWHLLWSQSISLSIAGITTTPPHAPTAMDRKECQHSCQCPYLSHPGTLSHGSPQATNSGPNLKSDLLGLLHTIRQTLHTPTLDSTPDLWFHLAAGPLTRSLNPFTCPLSAHSESNLQARTVSTSCLKLGKKRRFWGLGPGVDF